MDREQGIGLLVIFGLLAVAAGAIMLNDTVCLSGTSAFCGVVHGFTRIVAPGTF